MANICLVCLKRLNHSKSQLTNLINYIFLTNFLSRFKISPNFRTFAIRNQVVVSTCRQIILFGGGGGGATKIAYFSTLNLCQWSPIHIRHFPIKCQGFINIGRRLTAHHHDPLQMSHHRTWTFSDTKIEKTLFNAKTKVNDTRHVFGLARESV